MDFYEILQEIMDEKGIGIAEVARKCELTDSTVRSIIDRRQKKVALNVAFKLADGLGVSLERLNGQNKKAPPSALEGEAVKIAKRFDALDGFGKSAVRAIIDVEEARMKADQVRREQFDDMKKNKIIRLFQYSQPVSAGTGAQLDDEDGKIIEVILNRETAAADFCLRVSGHSMEPTYENGDIILIRSQPDIEYGEDGIFIIDGAGYVKEKGPDCLISKNYEYPDIFPEEGSPIKCVGKVIGILNPYDIIK